MVGANHRQNISDTTQPRLRRDSKRIFSLHSICTTAESCTVTSTEPKRMLSTAFRIACFTVSSCPSNGFLFELLAIICSVRFGSTTQLFLKMYVCRIQVLLPPIVRTEDRRQQRGLPCTARSRCCDIRGHRAANTRCCVRWCSPTLVANPMPQVD